MLARGIALGLLVGGNGKPRRGEILSLNDTMAAKIIWKLTNSLNKRHWITNSRERWSCIILIQNTGHPIGVRAL